MLPPKILYRQCSKCNGDLGRTGDMSVVAPADSGIIVEIEYNCVQCGKTVYKRLALSQEEYAGALKHYR